METRSAAGRHGIVQGRSKIKARTTFRSRVRRSNSCAIPTPWRVVSIVPALILSFNFHAHTRARILITHTHTHTHTHAHTHTHTHTPFHDSLITFDLALVKHCSFYLFIYLFIHSFICPVLLCVFAPELARFCLFFLMSPIFCHRSNLARELDWSLNKWTM